MNQNLGSSLTRLLLGTFALVLFFDFAYALLAFITEAPLIYQSSLLDLAFLPLWVYALLDLRLKQKQKEEKKLSEKRSDHLFDQSFEHVVLERQVKFAKTKLQPFMVIISMIAVAFITWQCINIEWNDKSQISNSVQAAFLLFRGSLSFVLARYLQGLAKASKAPHLETLAGLCLHHAIFMVMLSFRSFLHREGLEFLENWTLFASILPLAIYLLEVPLKSIQYYYSSEKPDTPPQTPKWLWFHWSKDLSTDAKSAMTYQFGYDLSSSLKEIGKKNVFTLLPIFLLCLWLGSAVHLVPIGHQGILVKLEKVQNVVEPGLHLSLPWPFGSVESIQTTKIHRLEIGGTGGDHQALLWSQGGHSQETYLIFQDGYGKHDLPVEVYAVNALLTYRINDVKNYRFLHKNPEDTIRCETKRLLALGAIELSRSSILEQERLELNSKWKTRLQSKMDELKLGIELLHFGLPQIHPPSETNESFQELSVANNKKDARVLQAEGEARQKKALMESAVYANIQQAHSKAKSILAKTEGDYQTLLNVLPVAKLDQHLFLTRRKLQKLIDIADTVKKVAILTPTPIDVQSLNLEPEFEPELLDLNLD